MAGKRPAHFTIAAEPPTSADILALLDRHLGEMHSCSPACKVNALPAKGLAQDNVTFFTARADGALAAIGALREIDSGRGEIKSMRAGDDWRGSGAGQAILRHLLAEAKARGYIWVGLETGRHEVFAPAHSLYTKHGFAECPPFGNYVSDDFSLCMGLEIA